MQGGMMKKNRVIGICVLFCLMGSAGLLASLALAQAPSAEKPLMYTYVSEWAIPRNLWAAYQKTEDADTNAMKKAVADGSLVAFGNFTVLNHQEGQPTHGSWFSASSMADLMKVLEGLRTAPAATDAALVASKHWDYIMQSRNYNAHSGTFKNGYLRVGNFRYKAGANDPDGKIVKATLVVMLEKLLADGALHAYQIDEEAVHSDDPGAIFIAIITNGAEGLDKYSAAIEEMQKGNPAGLAGFGSLIDSHGHRDTLARVSTMTHK
jgi:hypothetical protein